MEQVFPLKFLGGGGKIAPNFPSSGVEAFLLRHCHFSLIFMGANILGG